MPGGEALLVSATVNKCAHVIDSGSVLCALGTSGDTLPARKPIAYGEPNLDSLPRRIAPRGTALHGPRVSGELIGHPKPGSAANEKVLLASGPAASGETNLGPALLRLASEDELQLIASAVAEGDRLALALVCRSLCRAVRALHGAPSADGLRFRTPLAAAVCSRSRMEWSHECGVPLSEALVRLAAAASNLDVLDWLHAHGCPWNFTATMVAAAQSGDLRVIGWAHRHGRPADGSIPSLSFGFAAIEGGHLAVLRYLQEHGLLRLTTKSVLPWLAARAGQLEILRWLRDGGCAFDELTCYSAAMGGHLDVLKWLRAQGCPWEHGDIREAVRFAGHPAEMVRWVELAEAA